MGLGTESAMLNELRALRKAQEETNRLLTQLAQALLRQQPHPTTAAGVPWQQPS